MFTAGLRKSLKQRRTPQAPRFIGDGNIAASSDDALLLFELSVGVPQNCHCDNKNRIEISRRCAGQCRIPMNVSFVPPSFAANVEEPKGALNHATAGLSR